MARGEVAAVAAAAKARRVTNERIFAIECWSKEFCWKIMVESKSKKRVDVVERLSCKESLLSKLLVKLDVAHIQKPKGSIRVEQPLI